MNDLDNKIVAASAAEATYNADMSNVGNIQTAVAAATEPLAAAQSKANADALAFNAALDDLSAAALASKVPTV